MTKSLILAALVFGAAGGAHASSPSMSDQVQAASEPALLVHERKIILKQKELTTGQVRPDAYREWEAKFRMTLTAAIAGTPQSPENTAAVVRIQVLLGEGKSADAALERSLNENPENPALLLTKGQLLHKRGDFQGAADHALQAWEKSGRTDKSAWSLYQETKGRVAPSASQYKFPAAMDSAGSLSASSKSKDPSNLYTRAKLKPGATVIPNIGVPQEEAPGGGENRPGLLSLLGVAAGVFMIAWATLPQATKDSFVDPIALWRKTDLAANRRKAVTSEQFLDHYKGRTLDDVMRDKDENKTLPSAIAGGPIDEFRFVLKPDDPDVVLDMRHFLVVGRMGETAGLGIEAWQAANKQDSAFQTQDFISNHYGTKFFSKYDDSKPFDEQLTEFFKHPEKFDAPAWKVK